MAFLHYKVDIGRILADSKNVNQEGPLGGTTLLWAADADSCKILEVLLGQHHLNLEMQYGNPKQEVMEANHGDRAYRGIQRTTLHRSIRGLHSPRARQELISSASTNMLLAKGQTCQCFFGQAGNSGCTDLCGRVVAINSNPDCFGVADIALTILRRDDARGQF